LINIFNDKSINYLLKSTALPFVSYTSLFDIILVLI